MRIGRTLPPAASPIGWKSLACGLLGLLRGEKAVAQFANELKTYFGKRHCFLVSSGKAALTLILRALKERYPGRTEVIIPAYTCYSVPSAIVRADLRMRPCDLAENSLDFNFELLEPMLSSERLLAVVPTHLFGLPADIERLKRMVKSPEVTVVEDAAQAMGAEWMGKKLGTMGDASFFSLGRGKAFSTVEGGIILTDDDDLATGIKNQVGGLDKYDGLQLLKLILYAVALNIFLHPRLFWIPKGIPFLRLGQTIFDHDFPIRKISAFQAGLAKHWITQINKYISVRQGNIQEWLDILDSSFYPFFCSDRRNLPELIRFPVLLAGRLDSSNQKILERAGCGIGYPDIVGGIVECAEQAQDFPIAKQIANRLLTLPVHIFVMKDDLKRIKNILNS
jgi:perosamine synthetase